MVREFFKHNVPQVFIKKWSDDAKHVSWYNPITKEEKPNKTIVPLFRSPLIKLDIHEMMAISYLEANFTSYSKSLYESEFLNLKVGESVIRSEILFLFLGNPVYQERLILSSKKLQKEFDLSPYSGDRLKVMKSALHSTYIESILCKIRLDEFLLYDLEPVILYAPAERPFIIGGNSVVISNPLFGRDIPAFEFFAEPHLYKGAFIVLPISPDKALCLYDKDAYHLKSDRLSTKDADIINKQEIFSSGEGDGIVCLLCRYLFQKAYPT